MSDTNDTKVEVGGLDDPAALRETNAWSERRGGPRTSLVGQTVGSFVVTRVLGEGGVGTVYLGEHPRVGSRVAIKVLHDDFVESQQMVERFVQEARAANSIPSPHIVRVTDFGKLPDGRDYSVMEYLEGESLDAALEVEGPFSVPRAAGLLAELADAMQAAHAAGVIHRDLKPENIFLERTRDGKRFVRVLDFGIAKLGGVEGVDGCQTAVGTILGTPYYCAPEQARGESVTGAADIYSLGAVAYEILTGRTVFEGNVVDVLVAKSTRSAPPLRRPDVPQELEALVLQMLAREPTRRPGSMREIRTRLEPFVAAEGAARPSGRAMDTLLSASYDDGARSDRSTGRPVVVVDSTPRGVPTRRSQWLLLAVAAAIASAVLAVGVAVLVPSRAPPARATATRPAFNEGAVATVPPPDLTTSAAPNAPSATGPAPNAPSAIGAAPNAAAQDEKPSAARLPAPARHSSDAPPSTARAGLSAASASAPPVGRVAKPRSDAAPKGTLVDPFR